MAEILPTDAYDPTRNAMKVCKFCGDPVSQTRNSFAVGICKRHEEIWHEDIDYGLYRRNRLKELIDQYEGRNGQEPEGLHLRMNVKLLKKKLLQL